jgi:flagellar basal-body rod protein FlgG
MIRALSTAASGMEAQQLTIDNIANNLANVNTPGFKKARVEFEDLLYEQVVTAGPSESLEGGIPLTSQIGHGVRLAGVQRIFSQGLTKQTDNPLDLVIEGEGFFQVRLPDGSYAYTRDGSFKIDAEGNLVKAGGFLVAPAISLPEDARAVKVAADGTVSVQLVGDDTPQELGRIELVRFVNPAGLEAIGHNLYRETVASGPPIPASPGEEGVGTISNGYLEMSNVNVIEEMIGMITAQRAYEINSKAIQTAEEMLQAITNLKR